MSATFPVRLWSGWSAGRTVAGVADPELCDDVVGDLGLDDDLRHVGDCHQARSGGDVLALELKLSVTTPQIGARTSVRQRLPGRGAAARGESSGPRAGPSSASRTAFAAVVRASRAASTSFRAIPPWS